MDDAALRATLEAELRSEDASAVLHGVTGTHPGSYGGVTEAEALECAGAMLERLRAALGDPRPSPPPRPEPGEDEDGYPCVPEGWGAVVMGTNTDTTTVEVLAGWTAEGTFVQYAPTEAIVKVCIEALQATHEQDPVPASGVTTMTTPPEASYVDTDPAHQHGHTWRVTLHDRGHYCTGGEAGEHGTCTEPDRHADYWGRSNTVEVRASSLVGALARARDLPFGAWVEGRGEDRG